MVHFQYFSVQRQINGRSNDSERVIWFPRFVPYSSLAINETHCRKVEVLNSDIPHQSRAQRVDQGEVVCRKRNFLIWVNLSQSKQKKGKGKVIPEGNTIWVKEKDPTIPINDSELLPFSLEMDNTFFRMIDTTGSYRKLSLWNLTVL